MPETNEETPVDAAVAAVDKANQTESEWERLGKAQQRPLLFDGDGVDVSALVDRQRNEIEEIRYRETVEAQDVARERDKTATAWHLANTELNARSVAALTKVVVALGEALLAERARENGGEG